MVDIKDIPVAELVRFFNAQRHNAWWVWFEDDCVILKNPDGSDGDIYVSFEWAEYYGLQHGRYYPNQLASQFSQRM
jgi:hypothetical protein